MLKPNQPPPESPPPATIEEIVSHLNNDFYTASKNKTILTKMIVCYATNDSYHDMIMPKEEIEHIRHLTNVIFEVLDYSQRKKE